MTDVFLDRITLGALAVVAFLTLVVEVLFLPSYLDGVAFPVSALAAAVVNVLLVVGARTTSDRVGAIGLPLAVWTLGFLLCMFGGPGGDVLLLANWQTMLLLALGIAPPGVYLYWLARG